MSPFAGCLVVLMLAGCALDHRPLHDLQNYQARKFANVVQQQQDFSCGAAAVATLLAASVGLQTEEADVMQWVQSRWDAERISQRGFNLLQLAGYVRAQGVSAVGARIDFEVLKTLPAPVIVHMDVLGFAHFAVLRGIRADHVYLADSSFGNITVPTRGFLNMWADKTTGTGTILAIGGQDSDVTQLRIKPNEDVARLLDLEDFTLRLHPLRELARMEST